jgi:hypothetical protein
MAYITLFWLYSPLDLGRTQTLILRVGLEPATRVFEGAKTVHALNRAAAVIDIMRTYWPILFMFSRLWLFQLWSPVFKSWVFKTQLLSPDSKHHTQEMQGIHAHPISQPSLDISPIWTPIITAEVRRLQLRPVYIMCEKCAFYVRTAQRICLVSDDFYSDTTLILTTTAVK